MASPPAAAPPAAAPPAASAPRPGPASPPLGPAPAGPRSSSAPSPAADADAPRRTLLLVYIHGFYGSAQSFRSFPAHVHALLRARVAASHAVHSKIYPRYKTYRPITVARDNLSAWLAPHEASRTDVVLVGHSMGGLLAADLVLLSKHRILGSVALDSPFLGLHPGLVAAGISSLFQPAPAPAEDPPDDTPDADTPDAAPTPAADPHFDPPYWNDEPVPEQPLLRRIMHFASKHRSEGILGAVRNHVVSHLEFGGCLADYPGLVARYNRLRALDEHGVHAVTGRVRFVNYYTLSSGRPKTPKTPVQGARLSSVSDSDLGAACPAEEAHGQSEASPSQISMLGVPDVLRLRPASHPSTPTISVEAPEYQEARLHDPKHLHRMSSLSLHELDPVPTEDEEGPQLVSQTQDTDDMDLPPLPDAPPAPVLPDPAQYTDRHARNQAGKEARRAQKAYDRALKDRAKALRERARLADKRRKQADKLRRQLEAPEPAPPPRLRRFCCLPASPDDAWVGVYMHGVDEVGAHCGLFAPGPHYDKLVADVACRIADWVHDDMPMRAPVGGLS